MDAFRALGRSHQRKISFNFAAMSNGAKLFAGSVRFGERVSLPFAAFRMLSAIERSHFLLISRPNAIRHSSRKHKRGADGKKIQAQKIAVNFTAIVWSGFRGEFQITSNWMGLANHQIKTLELEVPLVSMCVCGRGDGRVCDCAPERFCVISL